MSYLDRTTLARPFYLVDGITGDAGSGAAISMRDGAGTKTDRSIPVTTNSTQAVPANPDRKRILIQNQDAAVNVFVNLGTAATNGIGSIKIGPGGFLDIEGTTQALNIMGSAANPTVTIWEF